MIKIIDVKFRTKIKQPHKTPIKTKFSLQCKNPLKQNNRKISPNYFTHPKWHAVQNAAPILSKIPHQDGQRAKNREKSGWIGIKIKCLDPNPDGYEARKPITSQKIRISTCSSASLTSQPIRSSEKLGAARAKPDRGYLFARGWVAS